MQSLLSALSFIGLYGVSYGIVLFLISVGLVVTMGLMRVVNLAHCAFAAIGGYTTVTLMNQAGVPFAPAVAAAVIGVVALSLVVERLCYVHLYNASELDQVLMTTGLMFGTAATLNLVFGPDLHTAHLPALLSGSIELAGRSFERYRLFVVILGASVLVALWFIFERTSFGARLRAAVDNRGMAEATGIDVGRLFSVAFALGSGLAALGGAVGFGILPLEPLYPFKYLTLPLVVVSLSDFGDIRASALVAIAVGVVDTAGRYFFPTFGAFIIYVAVIAILFWRDRGLMLGWTVR